MGGIKGLPRVEAQIGILDGVAKAQKNGADVTVASSVGKIRSIASVNASDKVQLREGGGVSVAPSTALKIAIHGVKQAVVNGHGLWTWQHMQARIPELNKGKVTEGSEASKLKKQIQVAYKEALNVTKEVDKVLKQTNPAVDGPIEAKNFEEYVGELQKRGEALAKEFSPSGKNWSIVALVAKVDDPFILMDQAALQKQIEVRVKQHVETYGKLPTRQKVIEMAAQQASYLNMPETGVAAEDVDIVDLSLTDLSADFAGYKDFPSPKMRAAVESCMESAKFQDAGGDFKDAMNMTYVNSKVMDPLHAERLQGMFAQIDAAPQQTGEHPLQKMALKVKNLMPGSRFFQYLSANSSGSKLNGEAINAYQRLLYTSLRDYGQKMNPVEIARNAYACAQKVQSQNLGPQNDATFQTVSRAFTPELKSQLATKGEINWIGVADDAGTKALLNHLRTVPTQEAHDGYGDTFLTDSNRSTFTFHFGSDKVITNTKGDDTERTELAKLGVRTMVDHDPIAAKTLSQVLSQDGIGYKPNEILTNLYHADFDKDAVMIRQTGTDDKGPDELEQKLEYIASMTSPNTIEVTYDFYTKADQMLVGSSFLPVNRDHKLSGDVSPANYAVHQRATVELSIDDLKNGVVNPKMVVKPMIEMHVKPDWGKIKTEQEDTDFRMSLLGKSAEETRAFNELAFSLGNDYQKTKEVGEARLPAWKALSRLAPGQVSLADNQETLVKHEFSAQAVLDMSKEIEGLSSSGDSVGNNIDVISGLPQQYLSDVSRQTNQFVSSDGSIKQADNEAQAIAMLNKLAKNDAAAKALGCLCNQALLGIISTQHMKDAIPGGTLTTIPASEVGNAQWIYKLARLPNGNISLELDASSAIRGVNVSTPEDGGQIILNHVWPEDQKISEDNYEMKIAANIELDNAALEKGDLKIVNTPVYGYTLRLKPDWNAEI